MSVGVGVRGFGAGGRSSSLWFNTRETQPRILTCHLLIFGDSLHVLVVVLVLFLVRTNLGSSRSWGEPARAAGDRRRRVRVGGGDDRLHEVRVDDLSRFQGFAHDRVGRRGLVDEG